MFRYPKRLKRTYGEILCWRRALNCKPAPNTVCVGPTGRNAVWIGKETVELHASRLQRHVHSHQNLTSRPKVINTSVETKIVQQIAAHCKGLPTNVISSHYIFGRTVRAHLTLFTQHNASCAAMLFMYTTEGR